MRNEKVFDLVVWLFIAFVGLIAAYVCFGILSSQASGQYQRYSVGGAIAGALISWSVLTSVYLQLRGSSNELQDLRRRTEELQSKLIRGAPRPQGFDTEVDERQRIVLARPQDWEPKGGTIFELELPDEKMKSNDTFPANFRLFFVPIEKGSKQTRDEFYATHLASLKGASKFVQSYSHEVVRLGGEAGEVESLKLILHQAFRTEIKKSPETGRSERTRNLISWPEFVGQLDSTFPQQVTAGNPIELVLHGAGFRNGTVCYINNNVRNLEVLDSWHAKVKLAEEDVASPGALVLVLENPETNGRQSNGRLVMVVEVPNDKRSGTGIPTIENEKVEAASAASEPAHREVGASAASSNTTVSPKADVPKSDQPRIVFQEAVLMRVVCHHEQLGKIYYFDFWDDVGDFLNSSAVFNRIIASTRFLS